MIGDERLMVRAVALMTDLRDAWRGLRAAEAITQDVAEALGDWFHVQLVSAGQTRFAVVKAAQRQVKFLTAVRALVAEYDGIEGTAGPQGAEGVGFAGFKSDEELLKCRIVKPVHDDAVWQALARTPCERADEAEGRAA